MNRMESSHIKDGRVCLIVGLTCMVVFFSFGALLAYFSEYDGEDLPWFVGSILGLFMEEDLYPSLTKLEWHIKYAHVHGEGLGVFCVLYGLLMKRASRPFVYKVTTQLVSLGTVVVPFAFLASVIEEKLIYLIAAGSVLLTFSFLCFIYDQLSPKA